MKKSQHRNVARRQLRRARDEGRARIAPAQPVPRFKQLLHRLGVRGERQKGAMRKWASLLGGSRPADDAK